MYPKSSHKSFGKRRGRLPRTSHPVLQENRKNPSPEKRDGSKVVSRQLWAEKTFCLYARRERKNCAGPESGYGKTNRLAPGDLCHSRDRVSGPFRFISTVWFIRRRLHFNPADNVVVLARFCERALGCMDAAGVCTALKFLSAANNLLFHSAARPFSGGLFT